MDEVVDNSSLRRTKIEMEEQKLRDRIVNLLENFVKLPSVYPEDERQKAQVEEALKEVETYLERDYEYHTFLDNSEGQLCNSYPPKIFLFDAEKRNVGTDTKPQPMYLKELKQLVKESRYARCWHRFPVPVILCNGKYICRSGSISVFGEAIARKIKDLMTWSKKEEEKTDQTKENELQDDEIDLEALDIIVIDEEEC